MANNFKNYFAGSVGTSSVDVYTVPGSTSATVIGMSISNIITTPISANVIVYNSAAANTLFMVKNATIAPGGALVPIGGDQKLVLEAGDKLQVQTGTATSADVILSVLEIS
jgi:hypothetical protein